MVRLYIRRWRLNRHVYLSHINKESMKQRLLRLLLLFLLLVVLHASAMMVFEDMSLRESLWLTVISVTTIGYGDISASTLWGQLSTVGLICFFGIWLLAQIAGEWVDYRFQLKEKLLRGHWNWRNMENHLVIINSPQQNGDIYLRRLVDQVRQTPQLSKLKIILVTKEFDAELPMWLRERGVVYVDSRGGDDTEFERSGVKAARYVLVLARDSGNPESDSVTLDILDRLREYGTQACITAECVKDVNKKRFLRLGAQGVMRPIRAYPELIVRALAAPGTEEIFENLFSYRGDSTRRYDLTLSKSMWKDVVYAVVECGLGTPLGYMDQQGVVHTNPAAKQPVSGKAIFILVKDELVPDLAEIKACLETGLAQKPAAAT